MREQWTPGALFFPPHGAGNQASSTDEEQVSTNAIFMVTLWG